MVTGEPVTPKLAVDIVIYHAPKNLFLVIKRKNEPFKGKYALPGGFVEIGETVEMAAIRELEEETGLKINKPYFVNYYDKPGRDPRGAVVSIAFLFILDKDMKVKAGDDAADVEWISSTKAIDKGMAFDHITILMDGYTRATEILFIP